VRLVLWDIDGTLVDSAGHGARAFEEAYEAVVGKPPEEQIAMAGRTDHQIALAMLERSGLEESPSRLPRMLEELATALASKRELIRAEGRPHPGATEALAALAARPDVVQSVLTGNLESNAAVKLSAFGLDVYVDLGVGGYGSDPHERRSDLVEVACERAARKYGVELAPGDVVLVGDTPLDVQAAHEARARCVAVATGQYETADLRAAGAEAVLPDLRDTSALLAALDDSGRADQ
jgi:phosphoglycolate phosphatase-like HAD superfamily hydrolase